MIKTLTEDDIRERVNIKEQIQKCKICPCVTSGVIKGGESAGCINCQHYHKDCNCDSDDINTSDVLALCTADDCMLTQMYYQTVNKTITNYGGTVHE